jgi:O-antigen/teichoic acid export membrane protein
MSDARRPPFKKAALSTLGTNLAVGVLSFVNVLIVARALGPTGRGDVAFLTTIAMLVSNLAAMGVQEANANIAGSEPGLRRGLAGNSVALAAVFGAAAAGVVALLIALVPAVGGDVDRTLVWLALAAVPLLILKVYLTFLVQADYGFAVTNAVWLLTPVANVTVNGMLAAVGHLTVTAALIAWVGGETLGALVLCGHVARSRQGFGAPDRALARRALGFGLKAHIGRVMTLGNYRIDQWFLGAIAGSRELGLYSVAVAWAEILFYVATALAIVQRPDLVRAPPEQAAKLAARVFRIALGLTAPMAVLVVLAAPILCVTIFGDAFHGSIDDLRVLALGALGMAALKLLGNALTAQRRPLLATAAIGAAFASTLVLDVLLIPSLEGLGAAIASTVAYTIGGLAAVAAFTGALPATSGDLIPRPGELGWLWRSVRRSAS